MLFLQPLLITCEVLYNNPMIKAQWLAAGVLLIQRSVEFAKSTVNHAGVEFAGEAKDCCTNH